MAGFESSLNTGPRSAIGSGVALKFPMIPGFGQMFGLEQIKTFLCETKRDSFFYTTPC